MTINIVISVDPALLTVLQQIVISQQALAELKANTDKLNAAVASVQPPKK